MADDNLQQKIARAKVAMTGGRDQGPSHLFSTELVRRRKQVLSLQSEGEGMSSSAPVISPEEIAKRREQAKRAMESYDQKKRREEREKAETEAQTMTRKIEEMKKARLEMERKNLLDQTSVKNEIEKKLREKEETYQKDVQASREEIANITKTDRSDIAGYHTLRTDTNNEVVKGRLTMTKIALEEEARRRLETLPRKARKSNIGIVMVIGSIVLVGIGLATLYGSVVLTGPKSLQTKPLVIDSIVFADKNIEIPIDTSTPTELKAVLNQQISNSDTSNANIINLYLTKTTTLDTNPVKTFAKIEDVFAVFNLTLPITFTHFIVNPFMLGVVHSNTSTSSTPFVILKTQSLENTLDALLHDESTITGSILSIFELQSNQPSDLQFKDSVITNIDARIGQNTEGQTKVVYGFLDRQTLVITSTENAFAKLVNAYQAPKPVVQ